MSGLSLFFLLLFGVDTVLSVGPLSVTSSLIAQAIAQERQTDNIIFSPANIQHSLALLYLGAEGTTAAQLKASLTLGKYKNLVKKFSTMFNKKLKNKKINFKIATRLYLAEDLEIAESFKGYAESFNTQVMHVKSEVHDYDKLISQWVHQQTSGKITDLITDHKEALLVNSIHFKAKWANKFYRQTSSVLEYFYRNQPGKEGNRRYWMSEHEIVRYKRFDWGYVVQLRLKDTKMSMLFIKPSSSMSTFVSKLKEVDLTQLPKELHKAKVGLTAPKFTIKCDTSLKSALGKLGIKSVFNNAHFNRILADNKSLAFSDLRHKTYIRVDKNGIEVASVTSTNPYFPKEEVLQSPSDRHGLFFAIIGKKSVYFAGLVTRLPVDMYLMEDNYIYDDWWP